MKKLILPIVIGVVMFAAAFGGAFYMFHYWQNYSDEKAARVADEGLTALKEQGRIAVFSARLMAVMAVKQAGDGQGGEGSGAAPNFVIIPGTVRYDLDLRNANSKDAIWDKEAGTLTVTIPKLVLAEPVFDQDGMRRYNGESWTKPGDAGTVLKGARKQALGQLLQQARDDAPMGMARDAARKLVERAFSSRLHEAEVKVKLTIRFADEKKHEDHDGGDHAAGQEE
ncbi:MAG: DUF4230 domain-containing protein [Sphingobium sp.]